MSNIQTAVSMGNNEQLSYKVIGCALEVHKNLGPGLLESVYEKALMHELKLNGLKAESQVPININYKGIELGDGLRLDILVEDSLILELKSVEDITSLHFKQLQTYLKITNKKIGLLLNFNVERIKDGIYRVVNDL